MDAQTGEWVSRRARRSWWRPVLLVVGCVVAVFELRGRLPDPGSTWAALRGASGWWLLAAVALQVLSMGAFGEQQRHFLAAYGVRMSAGASLGMTYARSAMATALPGGSAISAGYAYRQFRARGADRAVSAAVMLLSGVASIAGLALLYAGAALAWSSPFRQGLGVGAAVVATVAWTLHRYRSADSLRRAGGAAALAPGGEELGEPGPGFVSGLGGPEPAQAPAPTRYLARLRGMFVRTGTLAAAVPMGRWVGIVALAVLNWLTDLACLLAALYAVGVDAPVRPVAAAYLAIQLIRQIPLTPGGIGLVEASLVLALTTAGVYQAPAAAAVLIYRLLSCWSVVPIGFACWTAQKPAVGP